MSTEIVFPEVILRLQQGDVHQNTWHEYKFTFAIFINAVVPCSGRGIGRECLILSILDIGHVYTLEEV